MHMSVHVRRGPVIITLYICNIHLLPLSVSKDPIMQLGWKTGAIIPELQVNLYTFMYVYMEIHVHRTLAISTCTYIHVDIH